MKCNSARDTASRLMVFLAVLFVAVPVRAGVFELELPELAVGPSEQPELTIPAASVSLILVHVRRPEADAIDYGQIFTFLNGEAAATVSEVPATLQGKLVRVRLNARPGFSLISGRNTLEIRATNRRGRVFYASFVLRTSTENRNGEFLYRVEFGKDPAQRVPPELVLLEPEGAVELRAGAKEQTVRIAGVATATNRIERVSVGGSSVALKRSEQITFRKLGLANEANRVTFDSIWRVSTAESEIVVEAVDSSQNRTELRIPVRSAPQTPSREFRGRKFALLVGVSRFKNHEGGLYDLKYANADAKALQRFLLTRAGGSFPPENVLLLLDEEGTLARFRQVMAEFISKPNPEDLLLMFLSTHGSPDPYAPQNLYFLAHDTHVDRMAETALAMQDFHKMLRQNVRARRLVLLIDTCHSAGLTGSQGEVSRSLTNNLINLYAEKLLYQEEGRAIITSSDVNESSQESPRWGGGHGVFTHFLLDGMQGSADRNDDGIVTVGELFPFVRQKVRLETLFRQNPRMFAGTNESLAIAAVPTLPHPRSRP